MSSPTDWYDTSDQQEYIGAPSLSTNGATTQNGADNMKRNVNTDEATALFESVTSNKPTPVVGLWANRVLNLTDEKMSMGADMTSEDTLEAFFDLCNGEPNHTLGYILGDGAGWHLDKVWAGIHANDDMAAESTARWFLVEYATEIAVTIMAEYILAVQAQSMEVLA